MHDRDDQDFIVANLVNDSVGKAAHSAVPGSRRKWVPSSGMGEDPLYRPLDFFDEFVAEKLSACIAVIDGFSELMSRRRQERVLHR